MAMFGRGSGKSQDSWHVTVEVKRGSSGEFIAFIDELPGVFAQSSTFHDALGSLTFALEQHITATIEKSRAQLLSELKTDLVPEGREQFPAHGPQKRDRFQVTVA